jgi:hypothetical protein
MFSQGVEQEGRFPDLCSYATISMSAEELASCLSGEAGLDDPEAWCKRVCPRTPSLLRSHNTARFMM